MARSKRRRGNRSVVAQFSHLLSVVIWSINLLSIYENVSWLGTKTTVCFYCHLVCVRAFSECSRVCSSSPTAGAGELKSTMSSWKLITCRW
jgi:hypothetical protein